MKTPTEYHIELPIILERVNDHRLIKLVKQEAIMKVMEEATKDVDTFEGFDLNFDISMKIHTYSSLYDEYMDLNNIDPIRYESELSRLSYLKYKLGEYGTHLLEMKLTINESNISGK